MMVTVSSVVAREIKKCPHTTMSETVETLVALGKLIPNRFGGLVVGKSYFGGGLFGVDYEFLYLAERRTRKFLWVIPWTTRRVLVLIDTMDNQYYFSGIVYEPAVWPDAHVAVCRLAKSLGKSMFLKKKFSRQEKIVFHPLNFSIT